MEAKDLERIVALGRMTDTYQHQGFSLKTRGESCLVGCAKGFHGLGLKRVVFQFMPQNKGATLLQIRFYETLQNGPKRTQIPSSLALMEANTFLFSETIVFSVSENRFSEAGILKQPP